MKENVIATKTEDFAVRIVNLYKYLVNANTDRVIAKQILRSGTSIGANTAESVFAQSQLDFVNKLSIALKESEETAYWLRLMKRTGSITVEQFDSLYSDLKEITSILVSIIKTSKENCTKMSK